MKKRLLYVFASTLGHPGLALKFYGQRYGFETRYKVTALAFSDAMLRSTWIKLVFWLCFELRTLFLMPFHRVIYMRYNPKVLWANLLAIAWSYFKPVYVEYNGLYFAELRVLNRPVEALLDRVTLFGFRFSKIRHVSVTREIQQYLKEQGLSGSHLYIQNGYLKPEEFAKPELPDATFKSITDLKAKGKILGIFVGGGYPWQGLSRIQSLFADRPDVSLIYVGPRNGDDSLPQPWIDVGPQSPEVLRTLYSYCDFGIGPFDIGLKKLQQACPLKVREYLCFGLPVLLNYDEAARDFDVLQPYLIDSRDKNVMIALATACQAESSEIATIAARCFDWGTLLADV